MLRAGLSRGIGGVLGHLPAHLEKPGSRRFDAAWCRNWGMHLSSKALHDHCKTYQKGPSTQYLRTLVPKAMKGMAFGTRVLKYWVLGPFGL